MGMCVCVVYMQCQCDLFPRGGGGNIPLGHLEAKYTSFKKIMFLLLLTRKDFFCVGGGGGVPPPGADSPGMYVSMCRAVVIIL